MLYKKFVAPYVGAWIETRIVPQSDYRVLSHPTWVRGLKLLSLTTSTWQKQSHPTWVRGLKHTFLIEELSECKSHPTWVRGLKPARRTIHRGRLGRTLRGCVD